jgi:hypothetical protein
VSIKPRKTPCPTCPYRRDVPSGIWSASEYDNLPLFDGSTAEQAAAGAHRVFFCHQRTGEVCAGWAGCHDMDENLAIRLSRENLDIGAIRRYESPVPLFGSGAEAAEHGKRNIANPSPAAREKVAQLMRLRGRTA